MATAASGVCGFVNNTLQTVSDYFSLKSKNESLAQENARLLQHLLSLSDSIDRVSIPQSDDKVISARVISNSIRKDQNYITLDCGSDDGIEEGMGVVLEEGVVGTIYKTSDHYSLVMPLLNSKSRTSCKISGEDCFGFVAWNGGDIRRANVMDLPSHSDVTPGDTVVTSGYSSVFPKGLPIGIVESINPYENGLSPEVVIGLFVDFSRLDYVFVLKDMIPKELSDLNKE